MSFKRVKHAFYIIDLCFETLTMHTYIFPTVVKISIKFSQDLLDSEYLYVYKISLFTMHHFVPSLM